MITFSLMKSKIASSTIDLRSADLLLDEPPQAGDALGDDDLEDLRRLLERRHDRLADDLHGAGAEVGVGESEDLQDDADDALEVEGVGQHAARRRRARRRASPSGPSCRWAPMLRHEVLQAEHHARDEVAEEPDRVGDDVGDDAGRLRQDARAACP